MPIVIQSTEESCGAYVTGLDLRDPLSGTQIEEIRAAWLDHHVLAFPDQTLAPADLERFTEALGAFGPEPFVEPLDGHPSIVPVQRLASETGPLFAGTWHTDWSFLKYPPIGTCLYSLQVPPTGGDTLFANQQAALDAMPDELQRKLDGKTAIHSARAAYGPNGTYAQMDPTNRGMTIVTGEGSYAATTHPVIRRHNETGRRSLYGAPGHIVRLEGMTETDSNALLGELFRWQTRPEFQYRHKWQAQMLVLWDNRSLIHMATGGYQGHARRLLRTMIGSKSAVSPNAATGC